MLHFLILNFSKLPLLSIRKDVEHIRTCHFGKSEVICEVQSLHSEDFTTTYIYSYFGKES